MILFIVIFNIIIIAMIIIHVKKLQNIDMHNNDVQNKIEFCMHCGNVIDNKTKLCKVCGKKSK